MPDGRERILSPLLGVKNAWRKLEKNIRRQREDKI